jgi:excisionase family DNA binding protein
LHARLQARVLFQRATARPAIADQPERPLTADQAATMFNIPARTVKRLAKEGEIPCKHVGDSRKVIRVFASDLTRYFNGRKPRARR